MRLDKQQKAPDVWKVVEPGFTFGTPRLKCFISNQSTRFDYISSTLTFCFCSLFTMDVLKREGYMLSDRAN